MSHSAGSKAPRWNLAPAFALALVLAALWFGLSGGVGWLFGAGAVLAAVALSELVAPLPRVRLSVPGLLRFIAFFIRGSLAGGTDVARRALSPRRPLDVVRHQHRFGLPPGAPRAVFAGVVTLLPGTLSVHLDGAVLLVHSIAGEPAATLAELERRVAALFGLDGDAAGGRRDE